MQLDPSLKKQPISYMKSAVWSGIVPESVIVESQDEVQVVVHASIATVTVCPSQRAPAWLVLLSFESTISSLSSCS